MMGKEPRPMLEKRGRELVRRLNEHGIKASIGKFFDYHVQLDIPDGGRVNLYFSPRKNRFSLVFNEIRDGQTKRRLQAILGMKPPAAKKQETPTQQRAEPILQAYVDGSYGKGRIGYGAVILKGDEVLETLHGRVQDPMFEGHHQVGGELMAVLKTLEWCKEQGVSSLKVYYDYEGIQKWPQGLWRARKPATQEYARRVRESGIRISWQKVPAHSGVKWNEEADRLARLATG